MDFFSVKTTQEVKNLMEGISPLDTETVALQEALGRVLAEDIICPEDIPPFHRSAMDGFAVRAKDTFGASEGQPVLLDVAGDIAMGEVPSLILPEGTAVRIATGGMLPEDADAVVMVEHTHTLDQATVEVLRPVAPRENVIQKGEDVRKGDCILTRGTRLRPQDLGALAVLGVSAPAVFRQPRVGILSTGDELVPVEVMPQGAEIRDTNRYTLGALAGRAGALPFYLGIARDDVHDLAEKIERGLTEGDMVVLSAGSSVGTRDLTIGAIEATPEADILMHGVAVSPGKPTILAKVGRKLIWGLPGQVVSAMVIFITLVVPSLQRMSGLRDWNRLAPVTLRARVTRNIPSAQGREDYVRGILSEEDGNLTATPVFGKSGSLSTMIKSNALIRIDMYSEGVQEGEIVEVWPFLMKSPSEPHHPHHMSPPATRGITRLSSTPHGRISAIVAPSTPILPQSI
jgi:molybdopterin molybdotransferase